MNHSSDVAASGQQADPVGTRALTTFTSVNRAAPAFSQIANQLIEAIEAKQFVIGDRLPSEGALSSQFQVSRATVREALSCLQFAGYAESRRGSGTVVISDVAHGAGAMSTAGPSSTSELIDLFTARLAIEPAVVRNAATNPVRGSLSTLSAMLRGMELSLDRPELDVHTDLGVHMALVSACSNQYLASSCELVLGQVEGKLWRRLRDDSWTNHGAPQRWLSDHHGIAEAVFDHRPEDAARHMKSHLLSVLTDILDDALLVVEDKQKVDMLHELPITTDPQ
jgi:GntR family transcriptional regulator, transcriptional repressor for pyruvate dehydrogenase complex